MSNEAVADYAAQTSFRRQVKSGKGVWIAALIIGLWALVMSYAVGFYRLDFYSPMTYVLFLLLTHLYTGLFITAHDAMHGVVSTNKKLNEWIGRICCILFSFNFYDNLNRKHHLHHRFVGTDKDPDYHGGNFFVWYFHFAKQYVNIWQILLMAVTYNLLKLVLPMENLIVFWMLPAVLSTLQLFYFGTYVPHMGEHAPENIHKSRSQRLNHWWAFLSCYFFGYHYEHHNRPGTPWWLLHKEKELSQR
ncbi:fatty acid desaturase [Rhodoflexus caldus]|uniref:fatty acid desaturase n=1 Tax=Rhodoflexus caldus TaxID=2891236 RepID=UPI00374CC9EF